MKKNTLFAIIVLVFGLVSFIISHTDFVLISLVIAAFSGALATLMLMFLWKNKTSRYFSMLSIALSLYAILQFYIVNEENEVKEVKVEEGESETEKIFEEELDEDGFDLEDDEEAIE